MQILVENGFPSLVVWLLICLGGGSYKKYTGREGNPPFPRTRSNIFACRLAPKFHNLKPYTLNPIDPKP